MRALPIIAIVYILFILVTEATVANNRLPASFEPTNIPERTQWVRIAPEDALCNGHDHAEHGGRGTHIFYRFP